MVDPSFGEWIRNLREALPGKVNQTELGRAVGVSRGYISQIENDNTPPGGKPPQVSDPLLIKLAKALNVSEFEMFKHATWRTPEGFTIVPDEAGEYKYSEHRPLHTIIRDIGIDEKQFSHDDMERIQSGVEALITGYAVRGQQQQAKGKTSPL